MTECKLTVAENGYILEYEGDFPAVFVFEGEGLPPELLREIMCDLGEAIDSENYKFKITVNVEPIKE